LREITQAIGPEHTNLLEVLSLIRERAAPGLLDGGR
jgi:hypothetical protein